MLKREEVIVELAKVLVGPNEPIPDGSPYTLPGLQEHVWNNMISAQERLSYLRKAGHVYDFFMWRLAEVNGEQLVLPDEMSVPSKIAPTNCRLQMIQNNEHWIPRSCKICGISKHCAHGLPPQK